MTSYNDITGDAGFLGKPVTEMVINDDKTASFWFMKETHNYVAGDINHSGGLDMDDLSIFINYLLTSDSNSICELCGDVNSIGGVDMDDLSVMINLLLTQ